MSYKEEWHVTVEGDPIEWKHLCDHLWMKPLWIELSNFSTQLMCASATNVNPREIGPNFRIVRVKHEVSELRLSDRPTYYECHVKLDGQFNPKLPNSSRDLYRSARWYVTKRSPRPFDALRFVNGVESLTSSRVAGYEYEICINDTNRLLDDGWIEET